MPPHSDESPPLPTGVAPPVPDASPVRLTVGPAQAGQRLDRLLAQARPDVSRARVQALIADGFARMGGATVSDPARRVKAGESVELAWPEAAPNGPTYAESLPLDVVYEDAAIVVIDKPPGRVVHPAPGHDGGTLVNALIAHCGGAWLGQGADRRNGIVHRLDKDTSGLIVAAKTPEAAAALTAQFAGRTVARRYLAVAWGRPDPPEATLRGAIGRSPRDRKKMAVLSEGGRPAETHYRVRQVLAGGVAALLDCHLGTGRTHQIRVHLAEAGHPLLGDPLYGGRPGRRRRRLDPDAAAAVAGFGRQALHAATLGFQHPADGRWLAFTRPPPADLAELIQALGGRLEKHDGIGHVQSCI